MQTVRKTVDFPQVQFLGGLWTSLCSRSDNFMGSSDQFIDKVLKV